VRLKGDKPIRLGPPHCCACSAESGSFCSHIGPERLCEKHREHARIHPESLYREIAERRHDAEFGDRLRIRVKEDRDLLRRLAEWPASESGPR